MDKTNQQNTNNPSNKPGNQDPSKDTVKEPVTPAPEKSAPAAPISK